MTVFDDIIADMHSNRKLNPVVAELLTKGRKINSSLVFMTQSYFPVPKSLNSTNTMPCKIVWKTIKYNWQIQIIKITLFIEINIFSTIYSVIYSVFCKTKAQTKCTCSILSTFHVSKDYWHTRGNLVTFYEKKTKL